MTYSIFDALNLAITAMFIVFILLSLIMIAIMIVGKVVGNLEAKQAPAPVASPITAASPAPVKDSVDQLFEQDPLAKVAALTALTQASQDQQDKRFEIASIIKKS